MRFDIVFAISFKLDTLRSSTLFDEVVKIDTLLHLSSEEEVCAREGVILTDGHHPLIKKGGEP